MTTTRATNTIMNGEVHLYESDADKNFIYQYEGCIQNGRYHGEGCEFIKNSTHIHSYVGDYQHGKRHGHGRLTINHRTVYVGEFFNGKWHGEGTFYGLHSEYSGKFIDGKPDGKFVVTSSGQLEYEGYMRGFKKHGINKIIKKHGHGTEHVRFNGNTEMYQGDFVNDVRHGKCIIISPMISYRGEVRHGRYHGYGILKNRITGDEYNGTFLNCKRNGDGIITFADGYYKGEFQDDLYHGHGILINRAFSYEGGFYAGNFEGEGKIIIYCHHNRNDQYEGGFESGKFFGYGIYTRYISGEDLVIFRIEQYEGEFSLGRIMKGKLEISNCTQDGAVIELKAKYVGSFGYTNGLPHIMFHGQGKIEINTDNRIWKSYKGRFELGHITGHGKLVSNRNNIYEGDFLKGVPNGMIKIKYHTNESALMIAVNGEFRRFNTRRINCKGDLCIKIYPFDHINQMPIAVQSVDAQVQSVEAQVQAQESQNAVQPIRYYNADYDGDTENRPLNQILRLQNIQTSLQQTNVTMHIPIYHGYNQEDSIILPISRSQNVQTSLQPLIGQLNGSRLSQIQESQMSDGLSSASVSGIPSEYADDPILQTMSLVGPNESGLRMSLENEMLRERMFNENVASLDIASDDELEDELEVDDELEGELEDYPESSEEDDCTSDEELVEESKSEESDDKEPESTEFPICIVCCTKKVSIVGSCGHMSVCAKCAKGCTKNKVFKCPICRTETSHDKLIKLFTV